MKPPENERSEPMEQLDLKLHGELAKLGWTMPETDAQVRSAEEWTATLPSELPDRLRSLPELSGAEPTPRPDGTILSRYLRDEGTARDAAGGDRTLDGDQRDFEPDR